MKKFIKKFKNNITSSALIKYISKHWKRLILIVAIGLVIFLIYSKITAEPAGITTEKVVRTTFISDFSANGRVKAANSADLKFSTPGKVSWVGVKEGDKVTKWQGVAQLNTIPLNAAYQDSLNNYRNYQAITDQTLDSLQGHEKDETFAQRSVRTTSQMNRDNAYNDMLAAEYNLKNAVLVSPVSGTVVALNNLTPGLNLTGADLESKFVRIVDLTSLYFESQVDEVDYSKIKEGQEVSVDFDAYPTKSCTGVVTYVGKDGRETTGGVITIPVKVKLSDCGLDLAVGLNGQGRFVISKIGSSLVVPKKYIVNQKGQDYIWKQTGPSTKNRKLVPVTIGVTTSTEAVILEGLSENDTIIFIPGK